MVYNLRSVKVEVIKYYYFCMDWCREFFVENCIYIVKECFVLIFLVYLFILNLSVLKKFIVKKIKWYFEEFDCICVEDIFMGVKIKYFMIRLNFCFFEENYFIVEEYVC